MKYLYCILLSAILMLSGCNNGIGSGDAVSKTNPLTGQVTMDLDRKSFEVHAIEKSRQQCYAAIVEIEAEKAKSNQILMTFIQTASSDMTKLVGVMMAQQGQLIAALAPQKAPLTCNQMGLYEYKVERNGQLFGFGNKLLNGIVTLGKWKLGTDFASDIAEKLARPTIQAGDGSTNILGDNNTLDNSTAAPASDELVECTTEDGLPGLMGDSMECRPTEESVIDEPVVEEPVVDEPIIDPEPDPVADPTI